MNKVLNRLTRNYFDWRTWNYFYKNMRINTSNNETKNSNSEIETNSSPLRYINKPGITFSIDDSFRINDWYKYGKDLFRFYDVNVTFNIDAFHHYENRREITQKEIDMLIELQSDGHEIAHHGFKHEKAVEYSEQKGVETWLKDEIERMFEWLEYQSHSKTGEKFKKPVTFAFPSFSYNDQTISELIPKYFKIVRGHRSGDNLVPFNHTGFAPSFCIDSHYLYNPKNIIKILKFAKENTCNLIFTCHSILPENVTWNNFGWLMSEHEKRWKVSPNILEFIIKEANKLDMEFYTTAELSGVATFIDRNFENYVRQKISKGSSQWINISDLISIKELNLSNLNITNLDGIQYFQGLEKVDLSNNKINDFRLLNKLPNLKEVKLNNSNLIEPVII
ncbi:polysaccharide deacetylase family protein [Bacillus sp. JJ1566]|uniref:polysaccharide deacetylase family protein n=1 Tax=Bacillus sp. JJ1566 TaxID=3122961 RepID=UPI002FFE81DD